MSESRRQEFERDIDQVRGVHEGLVHGAGGTPGGTWLFFFGLVLAGVLTHPSFGVSALYNMIFDRLTTGLG